MRLVYDGILSRDEVSACENMSRDYRHAVELSRVPDLAEIEAALKQRKWTHVGENCVGQQTQDERVGVRYGLVQKNFLNGPRDDRGNFLGGTFLFVMDAEDHAAVVAKFGDILVNANPFRTALEVRA
ncbi:hypothetical protein GGE68_002911 [Rhizobium leguminosarum]|uniref:hypothetical protein n=1 Tax=Rhizobium leguminosarum TaxID=384 RepID=UPI00160FEC45|nr:hypothetical protein [Rhizobium leguminosarum]MBB5664714.1 hypothetical protein [Rhizobium leguminosarum]